MIPTIGQIYWVSLLHYLSKNYDATTATTTATTDASTIYGGIDARPDEL